MRISLPSFAAGALVAAVLVAIPATALPGAKTAVNPHPRAYDGTSPAFTLKRVTFVIGASIDAADAPSTSVCPPSPWNTGVPMRLSWSGADPVSGIAGYDVLISGPSHAPASKLADQIRATHFDFLGSNYDGTCGGGQEFDNRYWVAARDNRGNTSTSGQVSAAVKVWQENGDDAGDDFPNLPFTRSGWAPASCTCFNNGKLLYSTIRGAALTYRVTTDAPGQVVGVVADKNTNRGRLAISVDGGPVTSVPTFARVARHRVIVWQGALSQGTHTLKLVNAGTPSHPRVAIDSILLTYPPTGQPALDVTEAN